MKLANSAFDHIMRFWSVENVIFDMVVDIKVWFLWFLSKLKNILEPKQKTMQLAYNASTLDDFDCSVTDSFIENQTLYLNEQLTIWRRYLDAKVVFLTSKTKKFDDVVYRANKMYERISSNVPNSTVIAL